MDVLDPSNWPLIVKLLAGWGPLGIWAALAERRATKSEKDHHATRTSHEKSIKNAVAEAVRAAQERLDQHLEAAAAKDLEHQKQLRELTDRFVRLIEKQSAKANELVERVAQKTQGKGHVDDGTSATPR